MSGLGRQSRFLRSMTPSASVKMTPSKFNLVCGRTLESATRPNLERVPVPQGPKVLDSRTTTPVLRRRDYSRGSSMTRDSLSYSSVSSRPPRDLSSNLSYGSYAEQGIHTKAPGRYSTPSNYASSSIYSSRSRCGTPSPANRMPSTTYSTYSTPAPTRRNSISISSNSYSTSSNSSRVRHSSMSASYGTPASSRGIPFH